MKKILFLGLIGMLFFGFLCSVSAFSFSTEPIVFKMGTKDKTDFSNKLIITNENKENLTIDLRLEAISVDNFISVNSDSISLNSGDKKEIDIGFNFEGLSEGVHVGGIVIDDGSESSTVPVVFEVESAIQQFDVVIKSLPNSILYPGETINGEFGIYNLNKKSSDVILEYNIIDLNSESIFSSSQSLNVEDSLDFGKSIVLPSNLQSGDYVFYAKVSGSDGSVGTNAIVFSVKNKPLDYFWIYLAIVVLLIIIVWVFIHFWRKSYTKNNELWDSKYKKLRKMKFSDLGKELSNLKGQRVLLEKAYSQKYIHKKSYLDSVRKIDRRMRVIKKKLGK